MSRKQNAQLLQKLQVDIKVRFYCTKGTITDECKHIAAEEGLFAFHTNKYESIAVNVLVPLATQQIFEGLGNVTYRMNLSIVRIANRSKTRMEEWNTKSHNTFERWSEIFELVRSERISLKTSNRFWNSFAISDTTAAVERVFSITNALWTDKRAVSLLEPPKQ
jgi:hypothetical protein